MNIQGRMRSRCLVASAISLTLLVAVPVQGFVVPVTPLSTTMASHWALSMSTVVRTESSSSGSSGNNNAETTPMQIQKTTRSGKTKKGSNKKKSRKQKGPMTNPLSEEEIAHHVAEVYRHTSSPDMLSRTRRKKSAEEALKNRERDAMDALINPIHGEHVKFLRQLDGHPVLVLNANYQPLSYAPLSLWSWQDAVKAVFNGKVSVVETYSDVLIRAPSLDMILPSVIALKAFVPKAYQSRPSFTRRNVFLRDGYKCQYCSQRFSTGDLSLDHVVPRCRGGTLNWDNAVSCCKKCNGRKGSLMPTDLRSVGMALLRQPRCPTQYELGVEKGKIAPKSCHPTWEPYIQ